MILLQPNFKLKLTSFLCAQGQEEFGARYFVPFFDNMTESCVEQLFVARSGSFFSSFLCAHVCVCVTCVPADIHTVLFSLGHHMGRLLRRTTWFQVLAER